MDAAPFDAVLPDPDGRAAARYGAKGPTLVLVRPDRYIATAGDARDALALDETLALTFAAP